MDADLKRLIEELDKWDKAETARKEEEVRMRAIWRNIAPAEPVVKKDDVQERWIRMQAKRNVNYKPVAAIAVSAIALFTLIALH